VSDFERARGHYVYTFNTTFTIAATNDTKGIKLIRLEGVSIKQKKTIPMNVLKGI
jgi:hypothetical protein